MTPRPPFRLAIALLLVLFAGSSSVAFAGQENPTAAALAETRQNTDQGDASAQFSLGFAYATGEGVPQDDAQAVAWFRQAADQGHAASREEYEQMRKYLEQ